MPRTASRRAFLAGASALALTSCGRSPAEGSSQAAADSPPTRHYVFANAGTAPTLDPSLSDNTETNRAARQILDGLVSPDALTGEPVAALATSWAVSRDGLSTDFVLRRDVHFHDGHPLDAAAVQRNFRRWAAASVRDSATGRHSIFDALFRRGTPQGSLYDDCQVVDEHTVRLLLRRPYPALLKALTHPAFGMISPGSLDAGTAGTAPAGTGAFRVRRGLEAGAGQRPGESIELEANPEHWRGTGDIGTLEFVAIPDTDLRFAALRTGRVDAYDLVGLAAFAPLAREGIQVLQRDPYSVTYLGVHHGSEPLASIEMRDALMSAVDRQALARDHFPQGTSVAQEFLPARFSIPDDDVGYPGYNPQRARRLLEELDYDGTPLRFAYPLGASRPWALEPERLYADISAQLVRSGFEITPVPIPWSTYQETLRTRAAEHHLFLSGLSGGLRDPDFFASVLFSAPTPELALDSPGLRELVEAAAQEPDGEQRSDLYRRVNSRVTRHKAALPLAFPITAVAVSRSTAYFPLSSTGFESFRDVELFDV